MKKYLIFIAAYCCFVLSVTALLPLGCVEASWDEGDAEETARDETESDIEAAQQEISFYVNGEVTGIDIDSKSLVLTESNGGKKISSVLDNTYFINSKTGFATIMSLSDLSEGDSIAIDYYIFQNKKIADNITLEERGHKNESSEEDYIVPNVLVD
ncbi:MAG: hypothetical protein ABH843_04180 [Candidatus Omnitrophota bacterium]